MKDSPNDEDNNSATKYKKVSNATGCCNVEIKGNQSVPEMKVYNPKQNKLTNFFMNPPPNMKTSKIYQDPPKKLSLREQTQHYTMKNFKNLEHDNAAAVARVGFQNDLYKIEKTKTDKEGILIQESYLSDQDITISKCDMKANADQNLSSQTNTRNNSHRIPILTTSSFSNQPYQPTQPLVSVVPDHCGKPTDILNNSSESGIRLHENHIKNTPHYCKKNHIIPTTVRNLSDVIIQSSFEGTTRQSVTKKNEIVNQPYQASKTSQVDQFPSTYTNYSNQILPPNKATFTENAAINYIDSSKNVCVMRNLVPTTVQNISGVINHPCHKSIIGLGYNNEISSLESVTKMSPVNQPNQVFEQSQRDQHLTANKIVVEQDPHIKDTVVTRSNETDFNNQRLPAQSMNNTFSFQHSHIANQPCQPSERKQFSSNLRGRSRGSRKPRGRRINGNSTRRKPLNEKYNIPFDSGNTPSEVQYLLGNKCSKLFNENLSLAVQQNNFNQFLHQQRMYQNSHKGAMQNRFDSCQKSSNFSENLRQSIECSDEKQLQPIIKGYLLQDSRTGTLFIRPSSTTTTYDSNIQGDLTNVSTTVTKIPTLTNQHVQVSEQSHKSPNVSAYGKYPLQAPQLQKSDISKITNINKSTQRLHPQNVPPNNLSAVQDYSNSANPCCCSCKCLQKKQSSLVGQNNYNQDSLMQQPHVERTDGDCNKPSVRLENLRGNGISSMQDSLVSTNASFLKFGNSMENETSSVVVDSSLQRFCKQVVTGNVCVAQHQIGQLVTSENYINNTSDAIKNCDYIVNQSPMEDKQSPIYVDSSDQEEEIPENKINFNVDIPLKMNYNSKENKLDTIQNTPFKAINTLTIDSEIADKELLNEYNKMQKYNVESNLSSETSGCLISNEMRIGYSGDESMTNEITVAEVKAPLSCTDKLSPDKDTAEETLSNAVVKMCKSMESWLIMVASNYRGLNKTDTECIEAINEFGEIIKECSEKTEFNEFTVSASRDVIQSTNERNSKKEDARHDIDDIIHNQEHFEKSKPIELIASTTKDVIESKNKQKRKRKRQTYDLVDDYRENSNKFNIHYQTASDNSKFNNKQQSKGQNNKYDLEEAQDEDNHDENENKSPSTSKSENVIKSLSKRNRKAKRKSFHRDDDEECGKTFTVKKSTELKSKDVIELKNKNSRKAKLKAYCCEDDDDDYDDVHENEFSEKNRIQELTASLSKHEMESKSESNNNKNKMKASNLDDSEYSEGENHVALKKKLVRKRPFTLPAEYDPYDSKWTLKHKTAGQGIVELMPKTGVYINEIKLLHCKITARDCGALARLLLTEIFTLNALKTCSLTGAKSNVFDFSDKDVRPGLDDNARMVMFNFVREFGLENGWCVNDFQYVVGSVRSKIQDIRNKFYYKARKTRRPKKI